MSCQIVGHQCIVSSDGSVVSWDGLCPSCLEAVLVLNLFTESYLVN